MLFPPLLACGQYPEGGMLGAGPSTAILLPGGKGWKRPGAAVLSCEKPLPEGILIICNLIYVWPLYSTPNLLHWLLTVAAH